MQILHYLPDSIHFIIIGHFKKNNGAALLDAKMNLQFFVNFPAYPDKSTKVAERKIKPILYLPMISSGNSESL